MVIHKKRPSFVSQIILIPPVATNNNYLLTGKKVRLFVTEVNSRYFIARGEAEGNKSSRVNRGEIKALYCR